MTRTRNHRQRNTTKLRRIASERLFDLKREKSWTLQQFADAFDAKLETVRGWFNRKVLPRAESLAAIAEHFDVTIDWLLGIADAPMRPNQRRLNDDLESDIESEVARRVCALLSKEWSWLTPKMLAVDPKAFLSRAIEAEALEFQRYLSVGWENADRISAAQNADALLLVLGELVAPALKNADQVRLAKSISVARYRLKRDLPPLSPVGSIAVRPERLQTHLQRNGPESFYHRAKSLIAPSLDDLLGLKAFSVIAPRRSLADRPDAYYKTLAKLHPDERLELVFDWPKWPKARRDRGRGDRAANSRSAIARRPGP